jgi:hypothetical protein
MRDQDKTKDQLIRELIELRNKIDGLANPIVLNNELDKKNIASITQKDIKTAEQHIIKQNQELVKYLSNFSITPCIV